MTRSPARVAPRLLTKAEAMSDQQIDLARHALGLRDQRGRWRKSYRNYFCADYGSKDWWQWQMIVARGLAVHRPSRPSGVWEGDYFFLNRKGAEAVLQKNERLCPEDFPPGEKP